MGKSKGHVHYYVSTYEGYICSRCGKPKVRSASERRGKPTKPTRYNTILEELSR